MTRTIRFFPAFASAFFLLFTACSGGFLSVSNNPDVYKPATFQVASLEGAPAGKRAEIVRDLYGKRGDNLNWAEFWTLLNASPQRDSILNDTEKALLGLHERGCTEQGYRAFSQVVASTGRGFSSVFGADAKCDLPLGAEISTLLVRVYLQTPEGRILADTNSKQLLDFLSGQIAFSSEGKWRDLCADSLEADILRLVKANFDHGRSKETVRWMTAIRRAAGKFPLKGYLFERIVVASTLLDTILEESGFSDAVVLVADLIEASRQRLISGELQVSPSQGASLINALWADAIAKPDSIAQIWPDFSRIKRGLLALGRTWTLNERLALQNQLLLKIENSVRTATPQDRAVFFSRIFNSQLGTVSDLDSVWLMLRTAPDLLESDTARDQARSTVLRALDDASGIEERILGRRTLVHLAQGGHYRRIAVDDFCNELETAGIATSAPTLAALKEQLSNGLDVGCYRVARSESELLINATVLRMSPDAVIRIDAPKLSLQASSMELGIIDLSRVQTYAAFDRTVVRKAELVFPIPLVYDTGAGTGSVTGGKHVFLTHLSFAQNPVLSTTPLLAGAAGGVLHLTSTVKPLPFALVSEGGRGQLDRRLDYSEFKQSGYDALMTALNPAWTVTAHRKPSSQSIRQIAEAGTPVGGSAYSSALAAYVAVLDDYTKAKMKTKCGELRPVVHDTDLKLRDCLVESLTPAAKLAAEQDLAALTGANGGTAAIREAVERRFNGETPLWRPDSNPTFNEGPRGSDGGVEGL